MYSMFKTTNNQLTEKSKKNRKAMIAQSGCLVPVTRNFPFKLDFYANFNYLADGKLITISTSDLPNLIAQGLIVSVKQKVRKLKFKPDLWQHGFEVQNLPKDIQLLLAEYKSADAEQQRVIRDKIRESLELLVTKYFGKQAIALDTVYRNTNENTNGFKSVPLTHVDFPDNALDDTLNSFQEQWGPRVRTKLGSSSYSSQHIKFMVNVWMPLENITASPLVLCSHEGINTSRMHEYNAVRRDGTQFKAVSLTPPVKSDRWFYREGMKGQCYLFHSTKGIHSATQFPVEDGDRQSIEVRLGIFK